MQMQCVFLNYVTFNNIFNVDMFCSNLLNILDFQLFTVNLLQLPVDYCKENYSNFYWKFLSYISSQQ